MQKSILILAMFVGISVYAQDKHEGHSHTEKKAGATEVKEVVDGPKITFEETTHEFGVISEGEKAKHTFQFINDGTEPLILTNVKASCGCTTPKWPREPIMPGETGEIQAIYNSKNRPGKFNKAITIQSNAANAATMRVFIKGEVQRVQAVPTVPTQEKSIMDVGSN